jgi:hypothetical protein
VHRRTRSALAALALAGALTVLAACGGRTDGGNPIPTVGTSTTSTTVVG